MLARGLELRSSRRCRALLIAAGPESLVNRQLLARAPMVFVGRLSYSLYLWHWPVLSFGRIVLGPQTRQPS